jgi:HEAT repeat protein
MPPQYPPPGPAAARTCPRTLRRDTHRRRLVRYEAANAAGQIIWRKGADAAREVCPDLDQRLLRRLRLDTDESTKGELATALGELHYRPAIPVLIEQLGARGVWLRSQAAAALGVLRAHEAEPALRRALANETEPYAHNRMQTALEEIAADSTRE